jgi:hypothetical protein
VVPGLRARRVDVLRGPEQARIVAIAPAAEPGTPNSGDPHSPQNARVVGRPLSAVTVHVLGVPRVTLKSVPGTPRIAPYALPDSRWQSRQWQLTAKRGAAEHS